MAKLLALLTLTPAQYGQLFRVFCCIPVHPSNEGHQLFPLDKSKQGLYCYMALLGHCRCVGSSQSPTLASALVPTS